MGKSYKTVAGIDLGTTNSCVCIYRNEKVEVVVDEQGKRTCPSMVAFTNKGRNFGQTAKSQMVRNYENTVYDVKRLIGHTFSSPVVQKDMQHWGFKVVEGKDGKPSIQVKFIDKERQFSPEEISSMVIEHLVNLASKFAGTKIKDIVITVPAYFNDSQRRATMDAGELAGFRVLGVLNEPTAAAIAYGFENQSGEKKILVYDLGGGTFDVTVLRVNNQNYSVMATGGDTHLGGDDLDLIMQQIIITAIEEAGGSLKRDKKSLTDLRRIAEAAKIELSLAESTDVDCDKYDADVITISRMQFEDAARPIINKTIDLMQTVLTDVGLTTSQIDDVVLIGGSSRIPMIKTMLEQIFGEGRVYEKINPDEAVAKGAVIQAVKLFSALPEDDHTGDEDDYSDYSDDEGNDREGDLVNCLDIQRISIQDVLPLSIGLKTAEGKMSVMLKRNTPYGESNTRNYVTSKDNQKRMKVRVYQGERLFVKDNIEIGTFNITEIPPLPMGVANVDITMSTDTNGILTVRAVEKTTNKETVVTFENKSTNLSLEEILEMKRKAEEMREYDMKMDRMMQLRNEIERMKYDVENAYQQNVNTMDPEFRTSIESFIQGINEFLNRRDNITEEELEGNAAVCLQWIQSLYPPQEDQEYYDNQGYYEESQGITA